MDDTPNRDGRFWLVWCLHGGAPTVAHGSLEQANNEAMRLARVAPGKTFVVLEAQHGFRIAEPPPPPVERVDLRLMDLIPF